MLLTSSYTYNLHGLIEVILVNALMICWTGLVWSGLVKGRAAVRVLAVSVFVFFGIAMIHALIMTTIAR